MKPMRENMQLCIPPGNERAVVPDETVALIEGRKRHYKAPGVGVIEPPKPAPLALCTSHRPEICQYS